MTDALDDIMIDVPVYEAETEEKSHIDLNMEYFAFTYTTFFIYNKHKNAGIV